MTRSEENETLVAIEETQAELRRSIDETRKLAAESDRLLKKHRAETASAIPLRRRP